MYRAIVNHLCCPVCRGNLSIRADVIVDGDITEGHLTCENGHIYLIHEGVADFNSIEQDCANQWEELSKDQSFEDFDRDVDAHNPTEILERRKVVLDTIVDAISSHECKCILDIASGRGLLLTELAKATDNDVHIISIDLSAFVLKCDHQKFKRITPHKKISYLACDATNLPLKDNVVDAATTYGGFSNMFGCAEKALQEAHRVIKPAGILVDSYVVIEKESKGYEELHQVCVAQHITGAEAFFLHDEVIEHHKKLFSAVTYSIAFEGMGVGNGMDLLPYDGEWYAEQVFTSQK